MYRRIVHTLLLSSVLVSLLCVGRSDRWSDADEHCRKDGHGCPSDSELPGGGHKPENTEARSQSWKEYASDRLWSVVDTVSSATDSAYSTTVQGTTDLVKNLTESVRHVFREEFDSFLALLVDAVVGNPVSGKMHFTVSTACTL